MFFSCIYYLIGVEKGLFFSYPVQCQKEQYSIVEGLPEFDSYSQEKIKATEKELKEERDIVSKLLPN